MATLDLVCALLRKSLMTFSVRIPQNAAADLLQAIVFSNVKRWMPEGSQPFELELFVAKESGVWFTIDNELVDGAIERTINRQRAGDLERLLKVYETLRSLYSLGSEVTHLQTVEQLRLVKATKPDSERLIVHLAPIGVSTRPTTEEVGLWLRDLLTALKYLHGNGWCHGDVAWRNIVRLPHCAGPSYWVLIDVDEARPPNTAYIHWNHRFNGGLLCFSHDLYQVGQLLSDLPPQATKRFKTVETMLLSAVQDAHVTTHAVLALLSPNVNRRA